MDKTISIMEGKKSLSVIMSKEYGRGSQVIYDYLGMKAPAIIQKDIDNGTTDHCSLRRNLPSVTESGSDGLHPHESMSVDERLKKLGEVLGKEGESQALLANFYAKVEESKKRLKEAGVLDKTVSIMEGGKGNMGVVSSKQYGRGSQVIYEYLGIRAPRK
ncbi:hypothetical protein BRE01_55460 [Brevibacillus reuszeri]|uniref:Uncharacterized protein n=1 Tax=Brevibacillus reuszeri TaxID=54915 RepID=A0ABQ0TW21_9BACL|nr:hypothetical protein [Brevibacillus reuszeri]MED1857968.1 hypothetical protein [Brevibacillus reuszeri]GED71844.1 hypothetical protein BRE01_55460 [Brevibacillus reuszeri]